MDFSEKQTLKDYPEKEKTAYLAAVASMATPEDKATQEEVEFLADLCEEAELSPEDRDKVILEAQNPTNDGFEQYLDWLKNSDLKYSFVVDIISFAKADGEYTEEEKTRIHRMADKLGLSIEQYNALYDYVNEAEKAQGEETSEENFLEKTGLKEKLNQQNIPIRGLLTGLVGSMLMKGAMGRRHRRKGLLSHILGGSTYQKGGLSSLVGMLSGKRGYRRSGGLLSRFL
ncbi:TerB family tellurite resistance protein [Catalinimonas sp. 4WD22]|uniref:TerB family tellurite resistance protein n=1 Tax=Catalinimonas locisalis TaxID=3133978 RepID=UPI003100F231